MSSTTDALPERHLRLVGTRNFRDVGGYPAGDGRQTRWRTLYRTDRLDRLPAPSQQRLLDLGLRQVIDLRWPHELREAPSVFALSDRVRYRSIPLLDDAPPPEEGVFAVYRTILDDRGPQVVEVARALLDTGGLPAVIGCAAGKDRTGVTIAVLLAATGVPRDVLVADYVLSAECFARPVDGADPDDPEHGSIAVDCDPAYMDDTLGHLEQQYGGAVAYLERHGLDTASIDRLVDKLTEPRA